MSKITPVILSGGSGTRLWPLSRSLNPKQFLDFFDYQEKEKSLSSLFAKTISRVKNQELFNSPIIVCNEEHRFLVCEDLRKNQIQPHLIILEPFARNTAPAIAVAALSALKNNQDLILVMPSDHFIDDQDQFINHILEATKIAKKNYLVTLGVMPDNAETGYGYIEKDKKLQNSSNCFTVKRFIEKPNKEKAKEFLKNGNFLWNSGIFIFKASTYLNNLEKLQNNIFINSKTSWQKSRKIHDFLYLDQENFAKCDEISIDYAVMEKSDKIAVVPINVGWNDIGSWDKIAKTSLYDENKNNLKGDILALETKNCYINSRSGLVATIGIENLIIVNFKDVTLIINKDNSQDVKKVFKILNEKNREECRNHTKVLRPWGNFEVIEISDKFKVKKIVINPKSSLSLQMHQKRSEHWIVVKGKALITCDEKKFILEENQSTYISLGQKHRLENQENSPLEIIEVQTGNYLGEDDIIRFEDLYGRN